ncbi:hypothetical protein Plhal304r1_c049g0130961 [Plasmopara halstedii]
MRERCRCCHLKKEECCRQVCTVKSKKWTAAIYVDTHTNKVVEPDCKSVAITDHKSDALTRCVAEHTRVKYSTEFADRGADAPALDAVEFSGELVQYTTPHDGNVAC